MFGPLLSSFLFGYGALAAVAAPSSSTAAAFSELESYTMLPSTAAGPPVPTPPSYRVENFGGGAYMITDGLYQSTFFVSEDSVVVADAPPTIGKGLVNAVKGVTSNPVTHMVYSHHHADHIGGAYLYTAAWPNITIVAHELTKYNLEQAPPEHTRPPPDVTFSTNYTLKVGNQTLQLDYHGDNHDPGNIFIYSAQNKLIMLVDIVYPGWIPFNQLGEVQFVPGYINAHAQLLSYDFEHYIGGHLDRSGTRQDVVIAQEYIHDLFNTSLRAINLSAQSSGNLSVSSVLNPAISKVNPGNDWAVFKIYIDVLADWVYNDLAPRWADRLYATDVYGRTHAATMLESVRIDFGNLGPYGVPGA